MNLYFLNQYCLDYKIAVIIIFHFYQFHDFVKLAHHATELSASAASFRQWEEGTRDATNQMVAFNRGNRHLITFQIGEETNGKQKSIFNLVGIVFLSITIENMFVIQGNESNPGLSEEFLSQNQFILNKNSHCNLGKLGRILC